MVRQIKRCFDHDPVNRGRQRELDIAKGLIVIRMAISHSIEILGWFLAPETGGFTWHDFDMMIKDTVPVFLLCMGISMCYSKKQTSGELLRRALTMGRVVLLLELFRTVIPCFLEWVIFRDFESINYRYQVVCVDVLQFATLALFVMALFKRCGLSRKVMLIIAALCSVAGQLLSGVTTGSVAGDMAAGFLWHSYYAAYFPLLSWLIVPVLGYVTGYAWLRLRDKETFFRWVTPIGLVFVLLYYGTMALAGEWYYFSGGNFCSINLIDVAFVYVVFFVVLGICHYLDKWVPFVAGYFRSMGSRLNSVYCIHWTIYAFLYLFLLCVVGDNYVPDWLVIPVALAVVVVADLLSRLYKSFVAKRRAAAVSAVSAAATDAADAAASVPAPSSDDTKPA